MVPQNDIPGPSYPVGPPSLGLSWSTRSRTDCLHFHVLLQKREMGRAGAQFKYSFISIKKKTREQVSNLVGNSIQNILE